MTSNITIDFETRSEVDLKKAGAWKYSRHLTTDVLCLSYRLPSGDKGLWAPRIDPSLPADLILFLEQNEFPIEAHNAFFELCIWENVLVPKYGFPEIERGRWTCSAAKAAALSLPRDLEKLALSLHLPVEKDMEGRRLMLKMSKPRKPTKTNPDKWHEDPSDFVRLYQYCETDTETEELASEKMIDLYRSERELFYLDQKINLRGIYVDAPLIDICLEFIDLYSETLTEELKDVTHGEVTTSGQRDRILKWLKENGLELEGLTAAIVSEALTQNIPNNCRKVLKIRQALSKSSTKKLIKFLDMADDDNRIRGALLYHGASTGRWAGRGIQPQNFPRGTIDDVDTCIEILKQGDYQLFKICYPDILGAISSCLRGMITAPEGKRLMAADFSAIESRVLFWLAEEKIGLKIYHTHGMVYEDMASFIYQVPIKQVSKDQRQLGKAAILGCGYQMGAPKFHDTCLSWGIDISRAQAEKAVNGFRTRYKKVVEFWYALNNAAIEAVNKPGVVTQVGLLKFKFTKNFLFIRLPNGRKLAYNEPRIEQVETPFGIKSQLSFMGMNSQTRKWERQKTYGGKLAENVVQAVARDFMADAMLRLERSGYDIILTVHDEVVSEVPDNFGSVEEFEKIMEVVPSWGKGCPIKAEGWTGKRFKK